MVGHGRRREVRARGCGRRRVTRVAGRPSLRSSRRTRRRRKAAHRRPPCVARRAVRMCVRRRRGLQRCGTARRRAGSLRWLRSPPRRRYAHGGGPVRTLRLHAAFSGARLGLQRGELSCARMIFWPRANIQRRRARPIRAAARTSGRLRSLRTRGRWRLHAALLRLRADARPIGVRRHR